MKKVKLCLLISFLLVAFVVNAQVPFTPGNIVVYRAGDGSVTLGSDAVPAFLDEYTPSGVLVQSIAMPTAASGSNKTLTTGGTIETGGWITRSINGQFLVFTGYDASVGTSNMPFTYSGLRIIGLAKYNGDINTSTGLTDYATDFGGASAAVSTDGINLWASGSIVSGVTSGIRYTTIGSTTSVQLNSGQPRGSNFVNITDGQLYITSYAVARSRVGKLGTGLSTTSGQVFTALSGLPTTSASTYQFAFVDMNPAIPGVDVLYAADDTVGIIKYSLVGGTWQQNGVIGTDADDYRGLTIKLSGTTVTLFATKTGNNTTFIGGGQLVKLTDASGYNGTFSGTPTVIASLSGTDLSAFRGVALAPEPPSVKVSVKAFLQGAYDNTLSRHKDVTTSWAAVLNANALNQPYNVAPFNYTGTQSVSTGFFTSSSGSSTDILDWVLVELRDATTPTTVISRKAAFIREDGQIVDVDGVSPVSLTASPNGVADGNYYIVIRHRNHLSVRSASPVALNSSTAASYDFTTGQSQAFQNGAISNTAMATKDLLGATTSVTMLWGGNANSDNLVRASAGANVNDYLTLMSPTNLNGNTSTILSNVYRSVDMNLDGTVRASAGATVNDYLVLMSPGILNGNTSNIITSHQ